MTFGIDESNGNLFFIKNRKKTGHVKFMRLSDYAGCELYTQEEANDKKLGKTTASSLSIRFLPKTSMHPIIYIELYNVLDYAGFRRARKFGKHWVHIINKVCTK